MSGALTTLTETSNALAVNGSQQQFVTLRLGQQLFGISVLAVRDVMRFQPIAPVPLAPPIIAGSLNLRGRIVTAFDMRCRLNMPPYPERDSIMKIVVEVRGELYALMVDAVGDVMSLPMERFEKVPANMEAGWRSLSAGIFKLDNELLVILDVASVIPQPAKEVA